jgi:hypothetical protein
MFPQKICLIGGSGRSGTTILSKVFSQHPEVADIPECRYLIDPDGIIDFYLTCHVWSPYHYDLKVNRLESLLKAVATRNPFSRFLSLLQPFGILKRLPFIFRPRYADIHVTHYCPDFLGYVNGLMEQLVDFRYSGHWTGKRSIQKNQFKYGHRPEKEPLAQVLGHFLHQIMDSILSRQGVTYYLEKNTWTFLWFDTILELLPEARMVHIYRDPRDVVASYMKQSWMPSDPIQSAIIYRDIMQQWWSVRQRIPVDTYMEVALESFVTDPDEILRQICTFWGIPWHERLMEMDLSKSNTGRWKRDLDPDAQKEIQNILHKQIKELGYE